MPVKTTDKEQTEGGPPEDSHRMVHKHYLGSRVCTVTLAVTPGDDDDYDGSPLECDFCESEFGYRDLDYSELDYYKCNETGDYVCTTCGWTHEMERVMKGHHTKKHEEDEDNE